MTVHDQDGEQTVTPRVTWADERRALLAAEFRDTLANRAQPLPAPCVFHGPIGPRLMALTAAIEALDLDLDLDSS